MSAVLPIGARTVAEAFLRAETFGDRLAWSFIPMGAVEASRQLTYGELIGRSRRIATGLRELGVGPGERLAMVAGPGPEFITALIGAVMAGGAAAPVNHLFKHRELHAYLDLLKPAAVLVDGNTIDAVREALSGLSISPTLVASVPGTDADADLEDLAAQPAAPPPEVSEGDPAIILHTSGTTGLPKAVVRTHRAYAAFMNMWGSGYVIDGDRVLCFVPLYHQAALVVGWLGTVSRALPFFYIERFTAETFWDVVRRHEITLPLGLMEPAPTQLLHLPPSDRDREHSVRWLMAGSALDIWQKFQQRFGVSMYTGYGSTETTMVTMPVRPEGVTRPYDVTLMPADAVRSPAGRAIPGFSEFRVLRDDDTPTAPGELGRLQVRGVAVFHEYLHDAERTEKAFTEDGWFDPEDAAFVDAHGQLHVLGRTHEMIRRSGENIAPREIEGVIEEHAEVAEVAVVGVPDDVRGAEIRACVVRKPGSVLNEVDIFDHCREQLSMFKVPRYVEFWDELPKTGTNKVRKALLIESADAARWVDRYELEGR